MEHNGWGVNMAKNFHLTPEYARVNYYGALFSPFHFRAFNYHVIYTPHHVITVALVNFNLCHTFVNIYPRTNND
jgi:hypothetical protein